MRDTLTFSRFFFLTPPSSLDCFGGYLRGEVRFLGLKWDECLWLDGRGGGGWSADSSKSCESEGGAPAPPGLGLESQLELTPLSTRGSSFFFVVARIAARIECLK